MTETTTTAAAQDTLGRPAPGCLIPGCDGHWHYDDTCSSQLGELAFDDGAVLPVEHVAITGHQPYIVAFGYEHHSVNLRRHMTRPEQVRDFAQQLRDLAGQLDTAADHLAGGQS
ncbi:hypothetical protein KZO11_10115 [Streptomyces anulatus]|uniref:hypothetical protein n=1 Tax=Streptomyces anulatus TaxID=1892 RepID=UPI001C5D07B1|nr:hypothetical protein [Streptomyces anulatus]QYA94039.1 hypothetical protein KZO11_10115 [Streptomyces anulatus]